MSFRLVAVDLDDTLLRSDGTISERTRAVLRAVQQRGVVVTLATGRMFRSALPFALRLGFEVPLITYHGALVRHALSRETIYTCPVPREAARAVIRVGRRRNVQVNFYLDDELYVERITPVGAHYAGFASVPVQRVGDLEELLERGAPLKLLFIAPPEEQPRLAREVREEAGESVHITRSRPLYLEVIHPEATKGRGLRELAAHLGIPREEVLAFGDSYNDLELFAEAGCGVAVANACAPLKERASYVTASNDEDGVAAALEELVLKEG